MNRNDHERARDIVALDGAEGLLDGEQAWLRDHLESCQACRDYAEAAEAVFRVLHSAPIALDADLIRVTQVRLRARAVELKQQQERLWLVCLSCSVVGISATITTPLFWRIFEWIGVWLGLSTSVWQAGFAFFWIAPALVTGAVLVARGTHLSHNNNVEMQWK